ncbi:phosphotransferase [Candidatus Parcubacteria bacterium]|nr:phosphotransferase [Patescibacteria group bacterium]MBU4476937.1 phosphotransferase [Patescibacteria group bacterium]MCG2699043.1 phosphotransferase [Candidatus Parcubacteria bacterium]
MRLSKQKFSSVALGKILARFNLEKIKKISPLATSGNIAYVIKTADKSYFLRLCPFGHRWRSKKEIEAELELLNYLKKNNFPVYCPVKTNDGEEIVSWKKHCGYLREFSNAAEKLNPLIGEIKKFGEVVGRFHSLTENYKTKNKRTNIFDLKETQKHFKQAKAIILKSSFKDRGKFLEKYEKEILSLDFPNILPAGMIHEDLGKRHVLWNKNKISAIVDFDRAYYGKIVLDLGQACRGWCFTNNWKKWSNDNFRALIGGYQKERKLSLPEKKFLLDAINFAVLERALAFCLHAILSGNKKDWRHANNGLFKELELLNQNRSEIEKILKLN